MMHFRSAMALALGLVLVGCGGNGNGNGQDVTTDPDVVEETPAEVTPDVEPEVAEDTAEDGDDLLSCSEVIGCMSACGSDDTCIAGCMASVCPASATALTDFTTCVGTSCETECADRTSSECTACIGTNCATEFAACTAASC